MTQLYNATKLLAGYTAGLMKNGRNCLVIAAKATYDFPIELNGKTVLSQNQIPLFETDTYAGEPGYSAPISENDYPPLKPKCDVILLNAVAQAPENKSVIWLNAGIQIGHWGKYIKVVGNRRWQQTWNKAYSATEPEPFSQMPIGYENAYGGEAVHPDAENNENAHAYLPNPIGCGYLMYNDKRHIVDSPLPNTEEINQPIDSPLKQYKPMAFGPVGRNWLPRSKWGGTYDEHWKQHRKPFLPDDFDERYYHCAPEDQWIDYPQGGEQVTLAHLTPDPSTNFILPNQQVPMQVIFTNGDRHNLNSVIDTLVIDPNRRQFTLTWRARVGLKQNIHEVETLIVGKPSPGWERAHMMDKPYWNLHDLNQIRTMFKRQATQEQKLRDKNQQTTTKGGQRT